ncbi:DNA-binding LacI/PurR family transcriptional regulator [Paenibacillus sp. 4624]|uniref:hypothetical protein n=1 Tax=Paenibacillus sp. 4624 TaxID=3156453 RepID=UPI003D1AB9DE
MKGLIFFATEDEKYNESLLRLSLDKFPCVFIDRYLRNIETYTITSDKYGGAYKAVSICYPRVISNYLIRNETMFLSTDKS